MAEELNQFKELLYSIPNIEGFSTNIAIGISVWAISYAIALKIYSGYKTVDRRAEKAKKLGHIVKAKKINERRDRGDLSDDTDNWWHAQYSYAVNGKGYVYRYMERGVPPETVTLYYIDNPKKSFMKKSGIPAIISLSVLLLPLILGIGVMVILNNINGFM